MVLYLYIKPPRFYVFNQKFKRISYAYFDLYKYLSRANQTK